MFGIKRSTADKYFSDFIRERDDYICQRCHMEFERPNKGYHCSHFHSRGKKSVRFDSENAVGLCFKCHEHFTAEDTFHGGPMNTKEHRGFFEKRLGLPKFNALHIRAMTPNKPDEELIVIGLKADLKKMKDERKFFK